MLILGIGRLSPQRLLKIWFEPYLKKFCMILSCLFFMIHTGTGLHHLHTTCFNSTSVFQNIIMTNFSFEGIAQNFESFMRMKGNFSIPFCLSSGPIK